MPEALNPDLNPDQLTRYRIQSGDSRDYQRLVAAWEPIIHALGRGLIVPAADQEDLYQTGRLGLYHAVCRFDADRKFKFSTFASAVIRNAMADEAGRLIRLARPEDTATAGDAIYEFGEVKADRAIQREAAERITQWLDTLEPRHRRVVEMIVFDGRTRAFAAREIGVSSARITQIMYLIERSAEQFGLN